MTSVRSLLMMLIFTCSPVSLLAENLRSSFSTIFYVVDTRAMDPLKGVSPPVVQRMVDHLILATTRHASLRQAWASLIRPSDRIGIKVSVSGRGISGTHPAVVESIARGLIAAGVPRDHILVWDRNYNDLIAAGYSSESPYYVLRWIDPVNGYDPHHMVSSPIIGKLIWGDSRFGKHQGTRLVDILSDGEQLSSESFYAKVLTQEVDKVINVPSLLDSYLTGVHGALVNMTLSNLDNWRRFTKTPGSSYIAEIYADEMIHSKVVLTLLDGLNLQFAGGPYPDPHYTTIKNTLFASFDPVAIDAMAARMIDEMRVCNSLPKSAKAAAYVWSADQMGIGHAEEGNILLKHIRNGE